MFHPTPATAIAGEPTASQLPTRRWVPIIANLVVTMLLYEVYEWSRGLIAPNSRLAIAHADAVWDWEVKHGLFVEPAWQQFWLGKAHLLGWLTPGRVVDFLNTGYLYVHFLGTITFLLWLYIARREMFPTVRNIFFVTTGVALAVYILYPLAPPRLTPNLMYYNHPYTFIDTIKKALDPRLQQSSQFGYNPYAAMPSLHFGWSLIIGCTLFLTLRHWPLRILALGYPAFMLSVIVISGNHYFADALGSTAVVGVSTATVLAFARASRRLEQYPGGLWRLSRSGMK